MKDLGEDFEETPYKPSSLWWLIYNSFTNFDELKKIIGQAHKIMNNQSEEVRRVKVEQFLASIKKNGERIGRD
jgi:hypothetical protein